MQSPSQLLTTQKAAVFLHVSTKTVMRWADQGRLRSMRTLGGHRRYFEPDVVTLAVDMAASRSRRPPQSS